MIKKLQNNPENVYVASGYKEIGEAFELNRQRVTNIIASISRATSEEQARRIDEIAGDTEITDAEKLQLARELDSIVRDFGYIATDTANADLEETDEYYELKDAYDRLVALMRKIINSNGLYTNADAGDLSILYNEYTEKAKTLEEMVLAHTAETERINAYYSLTDVSAIATPSAVHADSYSVIRASILYDGVEKIDLVTPDKISFTVSGLDSDGASSTTVVAIPTIGYTPSVSIVGTQATITNCKAFKIYYNAIGDAGVDAICTISLDSENMPF